MDKRFDAVVIGAGQAGPFLTGRLCDAGQTVALIEKDKVGGTCVNVGCTPTKAMVANARAVHQARRGAESQCIHLRARDSCYLAFVAPFLHKACKNDDHDAKSTG